MNGLVSSGGEGSSNMNGMTYSPGNSKSIKGLQNVVQSSGVIHPNNPDKFVTSSGNVITRPKSKQQNKKNRQSQNSTPLGCPPSKFTELRKL